MAGFPRRQTIRCSFGYPLCRRLPVPKADSRQGARSSQTQAVFCIYFFASICVFGCSITTAHDFCRHRQAILIFPARAATRPSNIPTFAFYSARVQRHKNVILQKTSIIERKRRSRMPVPNASPFVSQPRGASSDFNHVSASGQRRPQGHRLAQTPVAAPPRAKARAHTGQ